jgi:hypothetical protein
MRSTDDRPDDEHRDELDREVPAHDPGQQRRADKTTTRPPTPGSAPDRVTKL